MLLLLFDIFIGWSGRLLMLVVVVYPLVLKSLQLFEPKHYFFFDE